MEDFQTMSPQHNFTNNQLESQAQPLKVKSINKINQKSESCHVKMNPNLYTPKKQFAQQIDKFSNSDYMFKENVKKDVQIKQIPAIIRKHSSDKKLAFTKIDKKSDQKQNIPKQKTQGKKGSQRPSQVKNIQTIILQKPARVSQLQVKQKTNVIQTKQEANILSKDILEQQPKIERNHVSEQKQKPAQVKIQVEKTQNCIKKQGQTKKQEQTIASSIEEKPKKLADIQKFRSPGQSHRKLKEQIQVKKPTLKQPKYDEIKGQTDVQQESSTSWMKNQNLQRIQEKLHKQQKQLEPVQICKDFQFFMKSTKSQQFLSLTFQRHNSCFLSEPISFLINQGSILESLKSSRLLSSTFIISAKRFGTSSQCAVLKSNFFGSIYNLSINGNQKDIICSILFNDLKSESNLRTVQIYIKENYNQSSQMENFEQMQFSNLKQLYNMKQNPFNIRRFISKTPQYNPLHNTYSMNFGMRNESILDSVKNTILVDENGDNAFKFIKNSALTYKIQFKKPFSWLVGYAYALASTDFKIRTE